jgi:hypothetical protein
VDAENVPEKHFLREKQEREKKKKERKKKERRENNREKRRGAVRGECLTVMHFGWTRRTKRTEKERVVKRALFSATVRPSYLLSFFQDSIIPIQNPIFHFFPTENPSIQLAGSTRSPQLQPFLSK